MEKYGSYILSYNGGMITNCRTGETVAAALLPPEINRKVIGLAREQQVNILTYEKDTIKMCIRDRIWIRWKQIWMIRTF